MYADGAPPYGGRMSKTSGTNGRVIVAGYDGSATARAAVDYAAREAGPDGRVFVVHAYGPPPDWLGFPNYQRVLDDHQEHGQAVIDGLALEDDALLATEWEAELIAGPPAEAILDVAHDRHADEIVVGSRGRGRLARATLGSVSHELLNRADLPVVVVPHVDD
jgi:nucleotide-binding universal stress UspA family protein